MTVPWELRASLDQKKIEVKTLMRDIVNLYTRLDMPSTDQCPLSTGQVCGVEELIKEENLNQLKVEKRKLEKIKMENMKVIIDNAKSELAEMWEACMVGEEEKSLFLAGSVGDTDETLAEVEIEINRLRKYYAQHKETLLKLMVYLELCDLAQDLKERMQDPKRLFKNRGKAMVQEEQDRRKVNSIPKRKEELLSLAEHKGNLMVLDEPLSTLVEDHAQLYEELFPPPPSRSKNQQSNSLSSTRSGKSFSTTSSMRGNKTASPRSTKKLGKCHTSPAARKNSRAKRTTPLSAQPAAGRPDRMAGTSPLARPISRMTRANTTLGTDRTTSNFSRRMQMPELLPSIHVNDSTINESVFSDNVPYNSTVCNETTISSSLMPDITMDMENTVVLSGLINKLVAARDAAVLQDRTLASYSEPNLIGRGSTRVGHVGSYSNKMPPALSKIPRQASGAQLSAKVVRKLRRSNSCSEIVMASRRQVEQRPRLGSKQEGQENLPSIREAGAGRPSLMRSNSCLTASGTKRGKVGSGSLSRAGSSTNLVLR